MTWISRWITRLFSPCVFGHSDAWIKARNAQGQLVKQCTRCQQPMGVILDGEMITTPLRTVVPGQPKGMVTGGKSQKIINGKFQ